MSDSREQFEAWVRENWPEQSLARFSTGEYQGFTVEHCWSAWQASRQALEITLPDDGISDCKRDWGDRCKDTFDCGYNYACEQHEKAIEAAGIRTKP